MPRAAVESGPLAEWDVSALPDGGRYYLRLTVELNDGTQSVVENQVIDDRSANPGWPKRVGPITHSPVLADIINVGIVSFLVERDEDVDIVAGS